jgi:hypothetical protein
VKEGKYYDSIFLRKEGSSKFDVCFSFRRSEKSLMGLGGVLTALGFRQALKLDTVCLKNVLSSVRITLSLIMIVLRTL